MIAIFLVDGTRPAESPTYVMTESFDSTNSSTFTQSQPRSLRPKRKFNVADQEAAIDRWLELKRMRDKHSRSYREQLVKQRVHNETYKIRGYKPPKPESEEQESKQEPEEKGEEGEGEEGEGENDKTRASTSTTSTRKTGFAYDELLNTGGIKRQAPISSEQFGTIGVDPSKVCVDPYYIAFNGTVRKEPLHTVKTSPAMAQRAAATTARLPWAAHPPVPRKRKGDYEPKSQREMDEMFRRAPKFKAKEIPRTHTIPDDPRNAVEKREPTKMDPFQKLDGHLKESEEKWVCFILLRSYLVIYYLLLLLLIVTSHHTLSFLHPSFTQSQPYSIIIHTLHSTPD